MFTWKSIPIILLLIGSLRVCGQNEPVKISSPSNLELFLRHLMLADESACLQRLICYAGANASALGSAGSRMQSYFGDNSTTEPDHWHLPMNRSRTRQLPNGYFLLASGPGHIKFKTTGQKSRVEEIVYSDRTRTQTLKRQERAISQSAPLSKSKNQSDGVYVELFRFVSRPSKLNRNSFYNFFRQGRRNFAGGLKVDRKPDIPEPNHADEEFSLHVVDKDWYEVNPSAIQTQEAQLFDSEEEHDLEDREDSPSERFRSFLFRSRRSVQESHFNQTSASQNDTELNDINLEDIDVEDELRGRNDPSNDLKITISGYRPVRRRRPHLQVTDSNQIGLQTFRNSFILGLRSGYGGCLEVYPDCEESMTDMIAFAISLFPLRSFS